MITETETLYLRLETLRMTPAERVLARAHLEQAEAFAAAMHRAMTAVKKLLSARSRATASSGFVGS